MRVSEVVFGLAVAMCCVFTILTYSADIACASHQYDPKIRQTAVEVAPAFCPESLNSTMMVIYNRIGKCGSSSASELLSWLKTRNNFQLEESTHYGIKPADRMSDPALVRALEASASDKPVVYVNHVFYFGDIYDIAPNSPRPSYIQIVREPIDRVISQYNFLTAPRRDKWHRMKMQQLKTEAGFEGGGDLDACVLNATNPQRCERTNEMTHYFCGYARECADPSSPEALRMAMQNVDNYVFVGILEDLRTTFAMFEKLLPGFFKGALTRAIPHANEGPKKAAASLHTLEMLRRWNANDLVLYESIVEKFRNQVEACFGVATGENETEAMNTT